MILKVLPRLESISWQSANPEKLLICAEVIY